MKTNSFVCCVGFLSPIGATVLPRTKPKFGAALGDVGAKMESGHLSRE